MGEACGVDECVLSLLITLFHTIDFLSASVIYH